MLRRVSVLAALGVVAAGVAGGQGAAAEPRAQASLESVSVRDDFFRPRVLTVSRGETVRFVWRRTRHLHNVSGGGRESRTTRRRGFVYRRSFRRSVRLVCTIHPDTMRIRIRVR
jgi:plastocyanin